MPHDLPVSSSLFILSNKLSNGRILNNKQNYQLLGHEIIILDISGSGLCHLCIIMFLVHVYFFSQLNEISFVEVTAKSVDIFNLNLL